jgi:glycosyltransferase involved in cell wall biosynthesis
MRLLVVNSFYAPEIGGGAEMTLQRLATGMARRGHLVAAFTTGNMEAVDTVDGVVVHRFPIDNAFRKFEGDLPNKVKRILWQWRDRNSALMAHRLDQLVRRFRPDIIQFHNLPGMTRSVWEIPSRYGVPSVQVVHDLNLICPSSSMFKSGQACAQRCASCTIFRAGYAEASRMLTAAVGVSQYVLDRVAREGYFANAERRVIYNAQDLPNPYPLTPGKRLRFGFIGSISPPKGLEWLIDQFDESLGSLAIAGTGADDYVESLRARASGKDVCFLGHVKPREFFRNVDVGVVPSIWNEALGNVAIEASAFGRPVIATRRGGLPEIVRDGVSGLLVDPDQPGTLGRAMRTLVDDRARLLRMAEAGPAAVRHFTSLDRFLDEYEGLYASLLTKRRPAANVARTAR